MDDKFKTFCITLSTWVKKGWAHGACLQEHNLPPDRKGELFRIAAYYKLHLSIGFSTSPSNRGGTLILMSEATCPIRKVVQETENLTRAQYDFHGTTIDVASVYGPRTAVERRDFFDKLRNQISKRTIAGGDWNCVPDVLLDVQGKNKLNYANQGAVNLSKCMAELMLTDYRRTQLEDQFEHTRKPDSGSTVYTRIDRWYVPQISEFADFQWDINIRTDFVWSPTCSDHQPLLLTIEPIEGERGKDRRTIREDLCYKQDIQNNIIRILDNTYEGSNKKNYSKWTLAMNKIATYLLDETAKLVKEEAQEAREIKQELVYLNNKMNSDGMDITDINREKILKSNLYHLEHPEAPHLASQAQAKSMSDKSEACSAGFFKTYKDVGKQSWINEIYSTEWIEGQTPALSDTEKHPQQIAKELTKYWSMVFAEKDINTEDKNDLLADLSKKAIYKASADALDTVIEDEEVRSVMDRLPLGKQAGPNRIPNAVYRCLSLHFAPKLAQVIREAITGKGKLPKHFLEGDITVLYKKADRKDPRNYRPLTMLNTDYKIYTKVLAERLKTAIVVHEFVSPEQKGFVPDVFIAECSMMLTLIENYINENPRQGKGPSSS